MQLHGARTDVERIVKRNTVANEAEACRLEHAALILKDVLNLLTLARLGLELLERERDE
jgi:hypothetical protein